jgi:creatinine amidohydrolase
MLRTIALLFVIAGAAFPQVRKLHTRDFTRLSQPQVAEQLKQSDVIFIPVGAVETNGILPSDRDYVWPLAFATAMAEETGGLFMPGLVWSYPGTTVIAPATIYTPPHTGTDFLKSLARSLLRQGFRRQVYVSMSHGPAALTVGTLVREFFEETHVPILYINMDTYLPRLKLTPDQYTKTMYGAHWMTGRIEDLPIKGDYVATEMPHIPENTGLATLGKLGFSGSLTLGSWVADVMAHGSGNPVLPESAPQREEWGRAGREEIIAIVKRMQMPVAMDALRQHDRYTQEVIVPKLGKMLP